MWAPLHEVTSSFWACQANWGWAWGCPDARPGTRTTTIPGVSTTDTLHRRTWTNTDGRGRTRTNTRYLQRPSRLSCTRTGASGPGTPNAFILGGDSGDLVGLGETTLQGCDERRGQLPSGHPSFRPPPARGGPGAAQICSHGLG